MPEAPLTIGTLVHCATCTTDSYAYFIANMCRPILRVFVFVIRKVEISTAPVILNGDYFQRHYIRCLKHNVARSLFAARVLMTSLHSIHVVTRVSIQSRVSSMLPKSGLAIPKPVTSL